MNVLAPVSIAHTLNIGRLSQILNLFVVQEKLIELKPWPLEFYSSERLALNIYRKFKKNKLMHESLFVTLVC